jgi:hypothetical protein
MYILRCYFVKFCEKKFSFSRRNVYIIFKAIK